MTQKRSAFLLHAVAMAMQSSGCGVKPDAIHLEIPNGFLGIAKIVQYEHGLAENETSSGFTYRVPLTGVLCIESIRPFESSHRLIGEYYNGEKIYSRLYGLPKPPSEETILLEELGVVGGAGYQTEVLVVIGTAKDIAKAKEERKSIEQSAPTNPCV